MCKQDFSRVKYLKVQRLNPLVYLLSFRRIAKDNAVC
jgi:hypothetical protein